MTDVVLLLLGFQVVAVAGLVGQWEEDVIKSCRLVGVAQIPITKQLIGSINNVRARIYK